MVVWGLWMQNAVVSTIRVHLSKGMVCFALCGHRQAVRPQLPKLVFAGSNPVARSIAHSRGPAPQGVGPLCIWRAMDLSTQTVQDIEKDWDID